MAAEAWSVRAERSSWKATMAMKPVTAELIHSRLDQHEVWVLELSEGMCVANDPPQRC